MAREAVARPVRKERLVVTSSDRTLLLEGEKTIWAVHSKRLRAAVTRSIIDTMI